MNPKILLALLISPTLVSAAIYETAFSLPIGGTLLYKIQACTPVMQNSKNICWEEPPRNENGDLIGPVKYQDFYNLPIWAISAKFWIWLKKDGVINELSMSKIDGTQSEIIANSIASKFGKPTKKTNTGKFTYHDWNLKNITIKMSCNNECEITFISPELARSRAELLKELEIREAKRPKSP